MDSAVQQHLDKAAVAEAVVRYADAVTRAAWDEVAASFTEDAVWDIAGFDIHVEGAEAISAWLKEATRDVQLLIQTVSSTVVTLHSATQAHATSSIYEMVIGVTTTDTAVAPAGTAINYEQTGIYYDEATKTDAGWRLSRRLFRPTYRAEGLLTGTVLAERASLA